MTLQNIIDMVHSFGGWQDETCYETKCEFYKGSFFVYNHYTYDTERDICHDTVVIDVDKTGKFGILKSVDITSINEIIIKSYPEIFDIKYYKEYLINLKDLRGDNR